MSSHVLEVDPSEIELREQAVVRGLQFRFEPAAFHSASEGPIAVRRVPGPGTGHDLCRAARRPGGRTIIALGTVTGHGLAAGLATAVLAGELSNLVLNGATPQDIVDQLDGSLRHINAELRRKSVICSLFCVDVNHKAGRAAYYLAGDVDVVLVTANGSIRPLERCERPLGRGPRINAAPVDLDLRDGARLVACTQGLNTSATRDRVSVVDVLRGDTPARERTANPDAHADVILQRVRADDRFASLADATIVVADVGIVARTKAAADVGPWVRRCARLPERVADASVFLG